MDDEELNERLAYIRKFENKIVRASIMADLALDMNDKRKALSIAREIEIESIRARTLAVLAPRLNDKLKVVELKKALTAIRKIDDEHTRARDLDHLLPRLNEGLILIGLEIAREIKDESIRASALASLAPRLNDELKAQTYQEALTAIRKIDDERTRARGLDYLLPRLNEGLILIGLEIAREIKDESIRASALASLAPRLNDDLKAQTYQEALTAIRKIDDEHTRARGLDYLLPRLNEGLILIGLEIAREIKDESIRASALASLAPRLNDELKAKILQEALTAARGIKDERYRGIALARLVPYLRNQLDEQEIEEAQEELVHKTSYRGFFSYSGVHFLENRLEGIRSPKEEISFTAYHSKEGNVKSWHTLLVYVHVLSALTKVWKDILRFDDQIQSPKETTAKSSTPIARGTELTIVPSCEGVTFNPERVSLKWMEDFHRADFRFKADQSLSGDAAKGSIDIYVGLLIIGTLKFAMLFNEKDTQPFPDHEEHAKMYGKDDVFISYSRKDS